MVNIAQHCFGSDNSGGPVVSFRREIEASSRSFLELRQYRPAGGIDFGLIIEFYKVLKLNQCQLVHVRGLGNEGFHAALAAKLAGVPYILVTIHGTQRDIFYPPSKLKRFLVVNILERLTLIMATHIATVCLYTARRSFLSRYKSKFAGVVHNGVPLPKISDINVNDITNKYELKSCFVAISVARITREKGYYVLYDALKLLEGRIENFVLFIAGGGDENGKIRELFGTLNKINIIFLGQIQNVDDYLSVSDLFIFPSLHENNSNSLLEAMSHGVPVIASDVGGNVEILESGGGVLFPSGSAVHLANCIWDMYSDRNVMKNSGATGRDIISQKYTVEKMVENWEQIYKKIGV